MQSKGLLLVVLCVSLSVRRSVCPHVQCFFLVAVVDTKRGSAGMCNGYSAQQASGAALLMSFQI